MFFNSWFDLLRVAVIGTVVYVALIVSLRVTGKRTLSKWNAFDFIVTISLGSILASSFLSDSVTLAEGVLAVVVLIGLQFVITWLSVRFEWVVKLVKAEPTLLLDRGTMLQSALRAERVTESEVRAAVRFAGIAALEDVDAVVLETDGSFSVIKQSGSVSRSALQDIRKRSNDQS
jgi:uncharacterized membrane protein YcaP (DUF421 family)